VATVNSTLKRLIDICISMVAIVAALPVLAVISLAILVDSGRPVLYRGTRVGWHGRDFTLLKFRTMNVGDAGPTSTAADDPRITPVGRVLRTYKLDELPQLINVLRGEMSLVGPRPQVRWAVDLYSAEELAILSVRPGLTDEASIEFRHEAELLRGSREPDRTYMEIIHPRKMELSLRYVREQNLLKDAAILLRTLRALIA
jgi:lipopolysaccharide/colanic/teichoic acid biosynthesis glycosyltransferase